MWEQWLMLCGHQPPVNEATISAGCLLLLSTAEVVRLLVSDG
jgi:hypothetical protein